MTEDEAKTKWCPYARVVQPSGDYPPPAGNREVMGHWSGALNGAHMCIASDCMAWRRIGEWLGEIRVHPNALADNWRGWEITTPEPDAEGCVGISQRADQVRGYCGLAGPPA